MIYANCHFTSLELDLIERALREWRNTNAPADPRDTTLDYPEARSIARDLCYSLATRCLTYREALRRNNEREEKAEADGHPF